MQIYKYVSTGSINNYWCGRFNHSPHHQSVKVQFQQAKPSTDCHRLKNLCNSKLNRQIRASNKRLLRHSQRSGHAGGGIHGGGHAARRPCAQKYTILNIHTVKRDTRTLHILRDHVMQTQCSPRRHKGLTTCESPKSEQKALVSIL